MKRSYGSIVVMLCAVLFSFSSCGGGGGGGEDPLLSAGSAGNALANGLVAYYRFNNDCNDASGNGYHGTPVNSPVFANNRFGAAQSAIEFTFALDNYVEVNHHSFIKPARNEITVTFWIKVTWPDTSNIWTYFIMGNDFGCWYTFSTADPTHHYVGFAIDNQAFGATSSISVDITPNAWVHIAGLYNGNKIKIYYNGVFSDSINWPGTITDLGRNLTIGEWPPSKTLDCLIDDLRIYDRVLSDAEILEIYNYHN